MVGSRDALTAAYHRLGHHIFREHNTKKLTCGQARVRRGVQKNGWTPPALRGKRFLVYVDSGMEAMTPANAVEALSAWPSRNHTDGLLSTKVWPCTSSLDAEVGRTDRRP